MKTCSKDEIASNHTLSDWEIRASATHKPIECAFGILKNRFSTLKVCINLVNENDAVFMIPACTIHHNICIDSGDDRNYFLMLDEDKFVVCA